MSLGLAMVVKDESQQIRRCLAHSYPLFDEIVAVDTGSSDDTPDILSGEFGARVLRLPPDHPSRKLGLELGIRNTETGNVQARTKFEVIQGGQGPIPNKELWADRGHLDFPTGFDGGGVDRLQPVG